ncbi:MAG: DNA polymerase III subunit gamma/tau [Bacteriovoracaceae bacterium]|jgi:DNA polymerase-3 subunit gamma/tau|nr:DNA polymerase III subunit gamma/tau [Bacteriovoracaceae bacterium]
MSYQVLARKWRPKSFSEVIGQNHITKTLQNALKRDKVAHAYLLTGTRGVGKTTVARIFAKSLRCLSLKEDFSPCGTCEECTSIDNTSNLNYIEIDGASNTGVDNIRELIDNVQYLPTSGDKKVYVIDEVHMLSVSAFNALLKTLEEPPAHVVFVFATTDPQKLLGTVLSRCQRYDFRHVDIDTLAAHVKKIAKAEDIKFENDQIIEDLAKHGQGSVRDTLSLLDQVLSLSMLDTITEDSMLMSLGLAKTTSVKKTIEALFNADKTKLIQSYNNVVNENIDVKKFSTQVLDAIFLMIEKIDEQGNLDNNLIEKDILEQISFSELLWIYEVLIKDFKFAYESINPEKMILFSFIKVALRSEVLGINSTKIVAKKKTNLEPVAPKKIISYEWKDIIEYVFSNNKTVGSNLEHGNIVDKVQDLGQSVSLNIGFGLEDRVFYDYLSGPEVKKDLKSILTNYFEKNVELLVTLLDKKTVEETEFKSKAQIDIDNKMLAKQNKEKGLKEDPFILEAQSLFNTTISNIKIKD